MPTPLLLILTAAGFGASPLLIAQAVAYFPPWTLAALRAALGLPLLLLAAGALGPQMRPSRHDLLTALVGGVLVVAIPFVSMAAGMQYIPSGMGGMLYATMPLFTLALAALFLADEPASAEQAIRIGTGLIGVAMISIPAILAGGFSQAGFGTLMVLISPLSYAAGNVWFRRRRKMAPLMLSAGMFAVGAITVWPLALLIDGPVAVEPSLTVIGVLVALVVLATIAPNLLNYALVQQAGANRAALAMFLMPGFSVLFGMIFRGERLPLLAFVGLALVIAASTARLPRGLRSRIAARLGGGRRTARAMPPVVAADPVPPTRVAALAADPAVVEPAAEVAPEVAVAPAVMAAPVAESPAPEAPLAEDAVAQSNQSESPDPVAETPDPAAEGEAPAADAAAGPVAGGRKGPGKRQGRAAQDLTPAERRARRQARRAASNLSEVD